MTKGKLAAFFGVFVPFCTWSVIPFVAGIVTVAVQVIDPVQVSRTVSPSWVDDADMAALIVDAEQSDGPTVTVPACRKAAVEKKIRLAKTRVFIALT